MRVTIETCVEKSDRIESDLREQLREENIRLVERFRDIFAKLDLSGFLMFHVLVFTSSIVQELQMCFFIGWREGGIKIPNL